MKNFKKVLALVLSLAMIISTFTVSFAAEQKTDAEICEALDLIKGDGDGVTDEYLASESPRWKIAIMTLRLRGLEDEALAFEGTETFEDAEELTWVAGRSILAYLKANPELGWIGYDNKVDPNGMMTVQQYYKVMLEALGYAQGTDFEWAEVMDFAAEKGLVAAANAEELTMADVAAVTVEVLKAENSDGIVLVDALVEAGAIDQDVAVDLDLVEPPVVANLNIKSVRAMNASYVKLTLNDETDVVPSADAFAIVDENDKVVEVKEVLLYGSKDVRLKTAAHTKNLKHTITYQEKDFDYVGLAADTTAPKVTLTAIAKGYKTVEISFDDVMEKASAEIATNYTIKDRNNNALLVTAAELTADKTVRLTTAEQKPGELYTITVAGVYNLEGLVVGTSDNTAKFGGVAKLPAPKVSQTGIAKSNTKVQIMFDQELDTTTAEDASNYTIKDRSGNAFIVLEAKVVTKDQDPANYNKSVYLTTAEQKTGELYTITVVNVQNIDGVVVDSSNDEAKFGGIAKDTTAPKVMKTAVAKSNSIVEATFDEEMDSETVNDVANYTIKDRDGKELAVLNAELLTGNKVVKLTTAAQEASELYKITIVNVKDISGNVINSSDDEANFGGIPLDTTAPKVVNAYAQIENGETYVYVDFDKNLDTDTATVFANYKFDNGLGYGLDAEVQTDGSIVKVLTNAQGFNTMYKVTVTGVKSADNVVISSDNTASFAGVGADVRPEVGSAYALNIRTVDVYLNTTVADSAIEPSDFTVSKNTDSTQRITVNAVIQDKKEKKVTLYLASDLASGILYDVEITTAGDQFINERGTAQTDSAKAKTQFAGTTTSYAFKVEYIMPVDNKTIDIYFNGALKDETPSVQPAVGAVRISGGNTGESFSNSNGDAVSSGATLKVLPTNKSVLRLTLSSSDTLVPGRVYYLWFVGAQPINAGNVSMALDSSSNPVKTQFAGSSVAQGKPAIDYILPIDNKSFTVKFKTPVTSFTAANLQTTISSDTYYSSTAVHLIEENSASDGSEFTVYLINPTTPGTVYTLTIPNGTNVANAAGTQDANITATLAGSSVTHAKPAVATASIDNEREIVTVTLNHAVATASGVAPGNDLTAVQLSALFDITGIFEDGTAVNGTYIMELPAAANDDEFVDSKTIKFKLSKKLKAASIFKVRSKNNLLVDKTGTTSKVDTDVSDSDYMQVSVPNVDSTVAAPTVVKTSAVTAVTGVKASLDLLADTVTVVAKNEGVAGNSTNVEVLAAPGSSTTAVGFNETANTLTITLSDEAIDNVGNAIVTAAAAAGLTLVDINVLGNGNATLTASSSAPLTGGVDAVAAAPGTVTLTFAEQMDKSLDTISELGITFTDSSAVAKSAGNTAVSWNTAGTVLTVTLDASIVTNDILATLTVRDLKGNTYSSSAITIN
ncbi:hypothetical protein HZI73_02845 [Vallitalea pronyensis]|uniref:SbsA Ig-like domain-containing protein n=1 Tax=Vallitalea pronyensis TaxID=1348613 RepID=A0A8J8MGQ5_9FIRM|nr:Ig-like domain-containing protein [Vallitalea pronyensis]QUI21285.1 hypothetical protein HZI73_02845 [Vallitalea pronyensis]